VTFVIIGMASFDEKNIPLGQFPEFPWSHLVVTPVLWWAWKEVYKLQGSLYCIAGDCGRCWQMPIGCHAG